jgi:multiple sugar transport system permease protein
MNRTPRAALSRLVLHLASGAAALLFLFPLLWMLGGSLRQPGLPPPRELEWFPSPVAWQNYPRLFQEMPLARYTFNSLLVAALAVPLTLASASWAGFALAQVSRRARRRLVLLALVFLLVPITALWLARTALFHWLGLVDTYAALLAPAVMGTSPLFVLLFFWAFQRQPAELYESARLEGAGAFSIWWRVALPLARATVVAVSVLTLLVYWSDFINPLLYLKSPELYTLPVGIQQLQQHDRANWPLLMAGAVVMTVPAVLLFLLVQRYFLGEDGLAGAAR